MNFTESFEQFSSKLGATDLVLYAGIGLVVWVLFKDRLSPVQSLLLGLINKAKGKLGTGPVAPIVVPAISKSKEITDNAEDVFFKLVVSWKQTRDLAVQSGCNEAVKVADQMFPFLSPNVCTKQEDKTV